jgi:hypothetical protein
MKELLEILGALSAKAKEVPDPKELFLDIAERIVKGAGAQLGAKPDEVAILVLTPDGKQLRFAAPRRFVDLGTIPVSKRDSIAVGVLSSRRGEVLNNVPAVKHVAFFESVKIRDRAAPIQKMITVPISHQQQPVGVAQISRKGDTLLAAGPDFTAMDLKKTQDFFDAVAPYLAAARPPRF